LFLKSALTDRYLVARSLKLIATCPNRTFDVISQLENTSGEMTMLRTLMISESVFDQLARAAKQNRLSPQALAERLLVERLSTEEQAWRTQFESLLARVHARMAGFDPIQIEADITAASSEVKAKRRAHRRAR
jgi:hypothetical protein